MTLMWALVALPFLLACVLAARRQAAMVRARGLLPRVGLPRLARRGFAARRDLRRQLTRNALLSGDYAVGRGAWES